MTKWTAKSMGRKGGQATSDAKREAARSNGARGGRPRTIHFEIAEPTEGDGIEYLDAQAYANHIQHDLAAEFRGEYRVVVEVIANDGTAESSVTLPGGLSAVAERELRDRAEQAMQEAESSAFIDEECYNLPKD